MSGRDIAEAALGRASTAIRGVTKAARIGRRILFLGDSITNGSSAGSSLRAYPAQVIEQMGSAAFAGLDRGSKVSGHPGERSDQMMSALAEELGAAEYDTLVTLQGTNDTGQWGQTDLFGRTIGIATFSANMLAQFRAAKEKGLALVVLTIPPRGNNAAPTATQLAAIELCNAWLRMVVPQFGTLVDVHKALVNATNTNNYISASYDSGDGIHPNGLGHWLMASQVVQALRSTTYRSRIIDGFTTLNLVSNPHFLTATTGWFEQPGGTGTAPTYSRIADTTGFLDTGNWLEMDFDGTASGGIRTYATAIASGWSVGDTLALIGKVQLLDTSADWQAKGPCGTGTAALSVRMTSGGANITGGPSPINSQGYLASTGVYNFGPFYEPFVVPNVPDLIIWCRLTVPTGSRYKMHLGEMGIINLTTSGLAAASFVI